MAVARVGGDRTPTLQSIEVRKQHILQGLGTPTGADGIVLEPKRFEPAARA
jgi:hypothetical protein